MFLTRKIKDKSEKLNNEFSNEIIEDINFCKKYGYNLEKYISKNMNIKKIKQIKIALLDELSDESIKEIINTPYKNELILIQLREDLLLRPDLK